MTRIQTKTARVRELLKEGHSPKAIQKTMKAERMEVSAHFIYQVKSRARRAAGAITANPEPFAQMVDLVQAVGDEKAKVLVKALKSCELAHAEMLIDMAQIAIQKLTNLEEV